MPHRTILFAARLAIGLLVLAACGPSQTPITTHETAGTAAINPHAVRVNLTPPPVPPVPRATKPVPRVRAEPALVSLQPCGGDLPPCWVKRRESGGDYGAYNPSGCAWVDKQGARHRGCFGAWQFGTMWAGRLGLPSDLSAASPGQQDDAARVLWDGGRGCANWAACG